MLTVTAYLDLSRDTRDDNRRAITSLYALSQGSKVLVFVGGRRFAEPEECRWLATYALDLHLEITGDVGACVNWSQMIREAI